MEVRFSPASEVRVSPEFRVEGDAACTVRGPVYPSFDPAPGGTYSVEDLNRLVDSWGTYITSADLRKLADDYMLRSQLVDRMHNNEVLAGRVVECTVRGPDAEFPTATWYGGVRVDEAIAPEVRAGKLRGFSIEVYAGRERITVMARGQGKVPDLTGVMQPPFYPIYVEVDGERRVSIDRLTALRPLAKSLVDRPAIRAEFAITRSELVMRVEQQPQPEEQPVTVENPAPAAPASDPFDEEPGWFARGIDRLLAVLRRDPAALAPDGTPPPAIAAEVGPPVVEQPEPRAADPVTPPAEPPAAPKEPSMSLAARLASTPSVAEAVKRMLAIAPPKPVEGTEQRAAEDWGFQQCWEGQEVAVNFYSMLGLLGDLLCCRFLYGPEFTDNAQIEQALSSAARDCTEFLAEMRELLVFEAAEESAEARAEKRSAFMAKYQDAAKSEQVIRALALLSPESLARLVPADADETEKREGKKYSKKTLQRIKDTHDACMAACGHLKGMIDEAEPPATDEGGESRTAPVVEPAATPVVEVPPVPTAAEREARALKVTLGEKDKALSEARAQVEQLQREAVEREARIASMSAPAAQPSAQPAEQGQGAAPATATDPTDWEAQRAAYRERTEFGRAAEVKG